MIKAGYSEENIKKVTRNLLKNHIMDLSAYQEDRHNENIGYLFRDNNMSLAPRYDNSWSFLNTPLREDDKEDFIRWSYKKRREYLEKEQNIWFTLLPECFMNLRSENENLNKRNEYWWILNNPTLSSELESWLKSEAPLIKYPDNVTMPDIYRILREETITLNTFIAKTTFINFNEIFRMMADSNIKVSKIDQEVCKSVYDITQCIFLKEKNSFNHK